MQTVAGVFKSREDPHKAAGALLRSGFPEQQVNVLLPGAGEQDIHSVPISTTEQPGMGSAMGGALGVSLPAFCNGIYTLPANVPGHFRFGGRNVTLAFIADTFSAGTNLGRPMVDQTGPTGRFDFTLEWAQERPEQGPPGADVSPDLAGPSFQDALREQLGIKLQARKGPVSVLVIDHVDRPSGN